MQDILLVPQHPRSSTMDIDEAQLCSAMELESPDSPSHIAGNPASSSNMKRHESEMLVSCFPPFPSTMTATTPERNTFLEAHIISSSAAAQADSVMSDASDLTPARDSPSLQASSLAGSSRAADSIPATSPSSAMVLYNPAQYQNRSMKSLPVGWTTASKSLTSFSVFGKLPLELQLMVWDLMQEPRSVKIVQDLRAAGVQIQDLYSPKYMHISDYTAVFKSTTPRPITLSICKESRRLTLLQYRVFFDFKLVHMKENYLPRVERFEGYEMNPDERGYIYLNPDIDSISIDPFAFDRYLWNKRTVMSYASPDDLMAIKRLNLRWMKSRKNQHQSMRVGTDCTGMKYWAFHDDLYRHSAYLTEKVKYFPGLREVDLEEDRIRGDEIEVLTRLGDYTLESFRTQMLKEQLCDKHPEWSLPTFKIVSGRESR